MDRKEGREATPSPSPSLSLAQVNALAHSPAPGFSPLPCHTPHTPAARAEQGCKRPCPTPTLSIKLPGLSMY